MLVLILIFVFFFQLNSFFKARYDNLDRKIERFRDLTRKEHNESLTLINQRENNGPRN